MALASSVRLEAKVTSGRFEADRSPGSLLDLLAETLGEPDLQVAVGVGNHDAVWKPTLQCFTPDGLPLAYVKVGLGPVGDHLVTTEREALEAWSRADDPRIVVPDLLSAVEWRGIPIICTAPMPPDVARLPPGPVSPWPVRLLDPPLQSAPLAEVGWWTRRTAQHRETPDVGALLSAVDAVHGHAEVEQARWHGDWVPWNLARSSHGLVVWDWEYSEPGAPVGLDEVHSVYQQQRILEGRAVGEALNRARDRAATPLLADVHVAMLATRCAALCDLSGVEVDDHGEVMAAARERSRSLRSAAE